MKLALNPPIIEFTNNGLKTWLSRITHPQIRSDYFHSPIKDILLLSHENTVIPCQRPI